MAKAPVSTNGIDLESDAPLGGDVAQVGDPSGDGHTIISEDDDNDNWDVPEGKKPAKKPEDRADAGDDDSGYDDEDARLAYSDTDDRTQDQEPRGSKRARRNAARSRAREAAGHEINALRAALEEQGNVIKSLVTGQSSLAVNTLTGQISQLEGSIRLADEEMANAIKNSDGDTFQKAQGIRDRIIGQLSILRSQKDRIDMATGGQVEDAPQHRQPQRQQVEPRVAQVVESYFDKFCDRFQWFDPDSTDSNCNIVRAVDADLVSQGYQRHTPVFWRQLERTLAQRYRLTPDSGDDAGDDDQDVDPPRRQEQARTPMNCGSQRPPTSNGRGAASGRAGFHLNETQTSMLRDEGLIGEGLSKEDIAKRDRIISKWRSGMDGLRRQGTRQ